MKNSKQQQTKRLEKFSNIFIQLGLVLVLFIVYVTLEHQTVQKALPVAVNYQPKTVYLEPDRVVKFVKETKPKPKQELPKKTQKFIPDEVKKGDNDIVEKVVDIIDDTPELIDINKVEVVKIKEPIIEDVDFVSVEFAPIFKGCKKNLSKEENKRCFDKQMQRFFHRNFDIELANKLGLSSRTHRIHTQFVIDDKGDIVDVKILAPHKALEKEVNRIIKKLPKFIPGKQNARNVKVRYTLPIAFSIE